MYLFCWLRLRYFDLKYQFEGLNKGFNVNNTIKGYNICKDHSKLKLESTLTSDDIFSVSIRIDYIKALSNSLLSDTIKIYADKENDIIFNLLIDNGVFEILIYTTINKYI